MERKKEKFRVINFLDFNKDLKSFFKTRLGLNSEGEFQELMEEDVAKEKVNLANTWWSGENLTLGKC
jgi:hypothetical protein